MNRSAATCESLPTSLTRAEVVSPSTITATTAAQAIRVHLPTAPTASATPPRRPPSHARKPEAANPRGLRSARVGLTPCVATLPFEEGGLILLDWKEVSLRSECPT